MSDSHEELTLRYSEIIDGYSKFVISSSKNTFYIKHLSQRDLGDIISYTNSLIKEAISKGIEKEEDQIKFIIAQGWWSTDQEMHINAIRSTIDQLEKTKNKLNYFSEKERINSKIKEHQKELSDLITQRSEYLGLTAEGWANSKSTEYCIAKLLYKNSDIKERCFATPEEFYDLEDDIIVEYKVSYFYAVSSITEKVIKHIAATGFLQNLLFVAGDSVMSFYGKPLVNLTKHQTDLLLYGKAFSNAIKNAQSKIPDFILESPEKFVEWFEGNDKSKELLEKRAGGRTKGKTVGKGSTFLFGEKGDLEKMGVKTQGAKLLQETKEKGGLSMQDRMAE